MLNTLTLIQFERAIEYVVSQIKNWFTEAALQNVNSQVNKCKILVNYIFSRGEGREALHA